MLNNLLINQIEIFEKQIVNDWWIRKETLNSLWTFKWRLAWFYNWNNQTNFWVQEIVEDKRILYLEKNATIKKWNIVKIDIEEDNYEVINIYNVQDSIWINHKKVLIKTIK